MTRRLVTGCTLALCVGLLGCGSESRDNLITQVLTTANDAAAKWRNVKNEVDKLLQKKEDLEQKDFKPALEATNQLKDLGNQMLNIKAVAEKLKETVTDADRAEFNKRFVGQLQRAMLTLVTEQEALNKALQEVETRSPEAASELSRKVRDIQAEFEAVSKPR